MEIDYTVAKSIVDMEGACRPESYGFKSNLSYGFKSSLILKIFNMFFFQWV